MGLHVFDQKPTGRVITQVKHLALSWISTETLSTDRFAEDKHTREQGNKRERSMKVILSVWDWLEIPAFVFSNKHVQCIPSL